MCPETEKPWLARLRGFSGKELWLTLLIENSTAEGISQVALKQAWGDWLTELGDRVGGWDWWVTLTFRERSDSEIAKGWTKVGWKYSQGAFDRYIGFLRSLRGIGGPAWVCGREYQHWRGVPHFHALLSGVAHLNRKEAWAWWFNRYGLARIEPYDRDRGAGFYLCKYVVKELGDIQFSEQFNLSSVPKERGRDYETACVERTETPKSPVSVI